MKKSIAVLALASLLILFSVLPCGAQNDPKPFRETLSAATLSVYTGKQVCQWTKIDTFFGPFNVWTCDFKRHFTCTGTVIAADGEGHYEGLTAGHCVDWNKEKDYFVGSTVEEKPVLHSIHILKAANDDRYDYALFTFSSIRDFPVVHLNSRDAGIPPVGTQIINDNFALGIGKQFLEGKVVSEALEEKELEMKRRYLVSIGVAGGASGSAIVDADTHEIVGLVEAVFPETQMATVVIPTGKQLFDFIDDDSTGLRPDKPTARPKDDEDEPSRLVQGLVIVRDFFKNLLGIK
jgi:hypothetical protein